MSISGLFNILSWLKEKLGGWFVVLTPVGAFLLWFHSKLPQINAALLQLHGSLVAAASPGNKMLSGPLEMWRLANYFAPVKLALALGVAILVLKCICAVIRVIKSFVPTIA